LEEVATIKVLHDEGKIAEFGKKSPKKFPSHVVLINEIFWGKFF
jgi:hypothetical protein